MGYSRKKQTGGLKEVQLDLQHFEIFIFLSLLPSLLPGKMREEMLTYRFSQFEICMEDKVF